MRCVLQGAWYLPPPILNRIVKIQRHFVYSNFSLSLHVFNRFFTIALYTLDVTKLNLSEINMLASGLTIKNNLGYGEMENIMAELIYEL